MGMAFQPKGDRQYSWSWGVGKPKVSADVAGNVMRRIEERDGKVTRASFLEESRPEESETHELFEWNDEVAAEKFRLVQSGKYIQNIKVTIISEEPQEPVETKVVMAPEAEAEGPAEEPVERAYTTRAFVSVADTRSSSGIYVNIEKAFSDAELRKRVLAHALEELENFQKKYSQYEELKDVFEAIERLRASYSGGTSE